jgi:hypothetical protein
MSMGKRVRERQHYTLGGINGRNQAITPTTVLGPGRSVTRGSMSEIGMLRQLSCTVRSACDLILHMKALMPVFVLLTSSIGLPQTSHSTQKDATAKCSTILRVNAVRYATTKDETIDSVTVCADGKITALHSFTAPAFG